MRITPYYEFIVQTTAGNPGNVGIGTTTSTQPLEDVDLELRLARIEKRLNHEN
jgi:hypothetical protein